MLLWRPIVHGVLLPALAGGVVLVLGRRSRRAAVLALGTGYLVGHAALFGFPPFPPRESPHRIFYLALVGAGLGLFEPAFRHGLSVRWGIRALVCGAAPGFLLRPLLVHRWETLVGAAWWVGLAASLLAFWVLLDRASGRLAALPFAASLLVVATGGSAVLVFSGSALLGQIEGSFTAALGAVVAVAAWNPARADSRAVVPLAALLLGALWIAGLFLAEVPRASAALLVLSPLSSNATRLRALERSGPRKVALVAAAATLLPVAAAVALAFASIPDDPYR